MRTVAIGLLLATLPLSLSACEWVLLPEDSTSYDLDGDGWSSSNDCDDFNKNAYPLAHESCNGVDNNCSGSEDDASDATLWYADLDSDGYGDPGAPLSACDAPPGYVESPFDCDDSDRDVFPGASELGCADPKDYNCDGFPSSFDNDGDGWMGCEDCDDASATVFPGAPETCNGVDDDCDGALDNGDASYRTWWLDADGDGWGGPAVSIEACGRPSGFSATDTDCDDLDRTRHPDALEACDGADNDCDDQVDEPDTFGNTRWYTDADSDGFGDDDDWEASCAVLPGRMALGGDCDDADASIHPEAAEICDGRDQDCDEIPDNGATDTSTWYTDLDRDGWGDEGNIVLACAQPPNCVAVPGDCDDDESRINPDASERCGGVDENCDGALDETGALGGTAWYADLDGDTWGDDADVTFACADVPGRIARGGDCDDDDAAFSPSALEIDCLDPSDYNCDGSSGRSDLDGDGWIACEDCDDASSARSPDASETCNELDDDCDGDTDEDAPGAVTWYLDLDGDAFGDRGSALAACEQPDGYVADDADCDDGDADVSPSALERCTTTQDDDCDGDPNRGASDCIPFYADVDGDGYGAVEDCLCEAEAPYTAAMDGDCDDGDPTSNPDGIEVCGDGADNDCDEVAAGCGIAGELALADADAKLTGAAAGDGFGAGVVGAGDLDGDGYADLLVGAPGVDDAAEGAGAVYLFGGPLAPAGTAADATFTWLGAAAGDGVGLALAAGDLDGDSVTDLVFGASLEGSAGALAGAVYLLLGPADGGSLADADGRYLGFDANDLAGQSVAILDDADLDGDGELAVGAHRESSRSGGAGAVYVIDSAPLGAGSLDDATAILTGGAPNDFFGRAITRAGDLDGDGLGDLAVGAYGDDTGGTGAGAMYIYLGPYAGLVPTTSADAVRIGAARGDSAGFALVGGADIDLDGYDDLVIGAATNDSAASNAGAAYVVRGPVLGAGNLNAEAALLGEAANDGAGAALAVGDLDDDGFADVIVSGTGTTHGGVGAIWAAYGPLSGILSLSDAEAVALGEDATDNAGNALAVLGDVDGDGFPDLIATASDEDSAGADAGAVYLLSGGPGL
ncbi:MAG: MopE-related protein [Pseudomonadota bacterium]|nr:MopE-related protein [Pseudomonadota bacterium]